MRALRVVAWSHVVAVGGLCACTALIGAQEPIELFGSDAGRLDGGTNYCPFPPCAGDSGDGAAPANAPYASGTRLRAELIDGAQGATIFLGWYDTTLGFDCTFQTLPDGSWRCVPSGLPASVVWFFTYEDSACTNRILVLHDPVGTVPAYMAAALAPPDACGRSQTQAYAIGAEIQATTVHYDLSGGICVGVPTDPAEHYYSLAPADPSVFVRAQLAIESHSGLDVEALTGDDGSRELRRLLDHARGFACQPAAVPAETVNVDTSCVPETSSQLEGGLFLDAMCTGSTVALYDGMCPDTSQDPQFETIETGTGRAGWPPGTCVDLTDQGFELGSRQLASAVFAKDASGVCMQSRSGGLAVFQEIPIDPSTLARLHIGTVGTGRLLTPVLLTPADGQVVGQFSNTVFWDTTNGGFCSDEGGSFPFADGVLRCVDDARATLVGTAARFSDSQCSVPLAIPHSGNCRMPKYAFDFKTSGTTVLGVRTITGQYTAPNVYVFQGGSCVMQPVDFSPLWTVGDYVDPDSVFARVTRHIE